MNSILRAFHNFAKQMVILNHFENPLALFPKQTIYPLFTLLPPLLSYLWKYLSKLGDGEPLCEAYLLAGRAFQFYVVHD